MAQCRKNLLPNMTAPITQNCTDTEEPNQPKINRLKRAKRTVRSAREHPSVISTESDLSSDPIFNCEKTCSTFSPDDQKFSSSAQPYTRSQSKAGAHDSAPKPEELKLKGSLKQTKLQIKSETITSHDGHLQKWRRPSENLNTSENLDRFQIRMSSSNRLNSSRRKKQHTPPANAAVHRMQQDKNNTTGDDGAGDDGTGADGTGADGTGADGTGDDGTGDDGTGDDGTGEDLIGDEVPWTEKYRPRCSDQVIGNSAAVKKLYSWLKEWRMRADVEERRRRCEERRMQEKNSGSWDCGDFKGDPMTEELCNTVLIHGPTGVGKTAAVYACSQELGFRIFEVNSSSLRSGQLVLSQLKECTQSHQVGAPHSSCTTHKPSATLRKTAPRKVKTSSKKTSANFQRKKRAAPPSITLKHFYRKIEKPISTHTDLPQGVSGVSLTESETTEEPLFTSKDFSSEKEDRKAAISLILFEEVDVIFDDDVGFFSAIRTLMSTSKRPIILTANDPTVGQSFQDHLEEIRFKTPTMESVVNYLQWLCAVEGVKPDPEHISFLLQKNKGDVRRSIFKLELWVRGGGGNTQCQLHKNTPACRSYAELQSSGCVQVLVESWRTGQSLLYSNLELLLAPATSHTSAQSTFDHRAHCTKFLNNPAVSSSPDLHKLKLRRLSRSRVKTIHIDEKSKRTHKSVADWSELDSLAKFFNSMSFLDSHLSQKVSDVCKSGLFGARVSDSFLDELSEDEVWTADMERWYEIQAVVEGLGFCTCRTEMYEMKRCQGEMKGQRMEELNASVGHTTWNSGVQETRDTVHKVLNSRAFRYNGNKTAVVTDYLPTLHFICRAERMKSQHKLRFPHYLKDIGLCLPKSTLSLLAAELR
ncbi:ATPase family AAA domain-containing protein 5b isoform X2 [Trichomycterus rosablanca]|uniref:ATPase family AAA domain-containing protein 5b isoform X2 n=1 Tax=Trichomycterus rosablanca TaxID=2290929 RepID=UPI002F360BA8